MTSNQNKNQNNQGKLSIGDLSVVIEAGYRDIELVLDKFEIEDGDAMMPNLNVVKDTVFHSVTGKELDIISSMECPVFLIAPVTSGIRYLAALNKWIGSQDVFSDTKNQTNDEVELDSDDSYVFVSDWGQGAIDRLEKSNNITGEKIVGWRWAFVDGATGVAKPGDADEFLIGRIKKFEAKNGQGISLYEYMMLVMVSLKNGKPIDQNTWTVISGEPIHKDSVLGGYFDAGYFYLQMSIVGVPYPAARFRSAISGSF